MATNSTIGTGGAAPKRRWKTASSRDAADVAAVKGANADAGKDCDAALPAPAQPLHPEGDIAVLARRHTAAALEAFVSVMQDNAAPPAARVAAATQILTWGHGKAVAGGGDDAPRTVRLAWEA